MEGGCIWAGSGAQAEAAKGAEGLSGGQPPSSPPGSMTAFPSPIVQRGLYPGMSAPGGRFQGPQCAHLWALVGPRGWRACVCVLVRHPGCSLVKSDSAQPSWPCLFCPVAAPFYLWPLSCVCVQRPPVGVGAGWNTGQGSQSHP